MRITLIHNPSAGTGLDAKQLVELFEETGHKVRACSTDDDWRKAIKKRAELVVAAGGDGTVRRVALATAGGEVPFAILPMGTANNIAKTLGITGNARDVIRGWNLEAAQPFDLATVTAPWGNGRFVESLGGGPFGELVESGAEIEEATLLGRPTDRALELLGQLLDASESASWGVAVDGRELNGSYLAVEVLNVRFVGPNVPLAPGADPTDGLLDVALVRPEDCDGLRTYLQERVRLASAVAPKLPVVRGRDILLRVPAGVRLHLDDRPWPNGKRPKTKAEISVEVLPGAARVVL
jgi:diacylglycerol kinase family enzyme